MDTIVLLGFFLLCSITIVLKDHLGCIKAIIELYNLVGTIECQFISLSVYMFLLLAGKRKIGKLDDFVIWGSLRHPKRREVIELFENIIHVVDVFFIFESLILNKPHCR